MRPSAGVPVPMPNPPLLLVGVIVTCPLLPTTCTFTPEGPASPPVPAIGVPLPTCATGTVKSSRFTAAPDGADAKAQETRIDHAEVEARVHVQRVVVSFTCSARTLASPANPRRGGRGRRMRPLIRDREFIGDLMEARRGGLADRPGTFGLERPVPAYGIVAV